MAKLSSWRERANARRTARQAPAPETAKSRSVPNKRDTKRWCKGKVGIEHKLVVADRAQLGKDHGLPTAFKKWLVRYCSECGKEVAWYYPMGFDKKNPPDWVLEYRAQKKAS